MSELLKNLLDTKGFSIPFALHLIEMGANVNTQNSAGNSLLHLIAEAEEHNKYNSVIEKLLKIHKADPDLRNSTGQTPLQCFMDNSFWINNIKTAFLLVRMGANPDTTDSNGIPLIHRMLNYYNVISEIEELVTQYHVDIHCLDPNKRTPLQSLIEKNRPWSPDEASCLIDLGADPNTQDSRQNSLIYILTTCGGLNDSKKGLISKLTNEYKVDINAAHPRHKKTPLQYILDKETLDMERILFLIRCGARANTTASDGQNLIHKLVLKDKKLSTQNKATITRLVKEYNVSLNEEDIYGKTAFQYALDQEPDFEDLEFFLQLGANPDTKSSLGTPIFHRLIKGATGGHNKIFSEHEIIIHRFVREYNVNPNAQDNCGRTALQDVLDHPMHYDNFYFLMALGANPETKNSLGYPCLHRLMLNSMDKSEDAGILVTLFPALLLAQDKDGFTAFEKAIHILKNGFGHPANIIPVVKNAPDFINKLKTAFNSQSKNIAEINSIFNIVHKRKRSQSYELQGLIRNMAFEAFVESLASLDPTDKLTRLKWARTQTIFKEHRSYSFFASIGRTNTVIQIDQMIEEVETQLDAAPVAKKK